MSQGRVLSREDVGSGPPLLLIHGLGADHRDWHDVQRVLSQRYRVIAVDLRGYGNSPPGPGGYTPQAHADDVLATLDALNIPRAAVVGHSMGGAVALSLALAQPKRVDALVICNSVPGFRPERPRDLAEVGLRLVTMAVLGPRRLGRIMARRMFPGADQARQREMIRERTARNRRGVYLSSLIALCRWSAHGRLGELSLPAMIVASGNDYFPVDDLRGYAAAIAGAEFRLFEDARHGLPLECGEELAACIDDFLARHLVAAAAAPATVEGERPERQCGEAPAPGISAS